MATFDYASVRALADELIEEFGQAATLTRPTDGGGDPWNPTLGATGTYEVSIVPLDASFFDRPGSLIEAGRDTVLVSAEGLAVVPSRSDRLTYRGGSHEITDVRPLDPGGVAVLFELDVVR